MAKLPYFPFYVDDFDNSKSVRSMSAAEVGIYILTLCECWRTGSIPDDCEQVALLIRRKHSEVEPCWQAVRKCFMSVGGDLVNPDLEVLRTKAVEKSELASKAAEASWKNRRLKHEQLEASAGAFADAHAAAGAHVNAAASTDAMPRAYESVSVSLSSPEAKNENANSHESGPGYWTKKMLSRHPKKKDSAGALPWVEKIWEMLSEPKDNGMRDLDVKHASKCRSDDWTKEEGRFASTLPSWLEKYHEKLISAPPSARIASESEPPPEMSDQEVLTTLPHTFRAKAIRSREAAPRYNPIAKRMERPNGGT